MAAVETVYAVLLVLALALNGIAIAGRRTLRELLAPLGEPGRILRILALDLLLVPAIALGAATALGVDPVTRAGLVIVAAASSGPIGMALTRIARGDVALSVSLVVGLGVLNLGTVPIVTGLLLPEGITIPITDLLASLLGLAVAPLLLGRAVAHLATRSRMSETSFTRMMEAAGRSADVLLTAAVAVAFVIEPRDVLTALAGPVTPVAIAVMLAVALGARAVTSDRMRVRTIAIGINARAVGLALTLATVHLGEVEGLRAAILAYGGLTQVVPLAVVLLLRRPRPRGAAAADRPRS